MEVRELHKKPLNTCSKEVYDEKLKKLRKDHDRLKKGRFEFVDAGGGWFEFNTRFFPGEPIVFYKITHGEIVELPAGVVKHLNNTVRKVRTFSPELGARGVPSTFVAQSRVRFISMDDL